MEEQAPDIPTHKMSEEAFIAWDEARTSTVRVEFHDGQIYTMQSENLRHNFAKSAISAQFLSQLGFGKRCTPYADGMRVRTPNGTLYEPDAMIRCGDRLGGDANIIEDPVVIVEVLSPSNTKIAMAVKQENYFSCESLVHFVLFDPVAKLFFHTVRGPAPDKYLTTVYRGGLLELDPPGVTLDLDAVFAAVDAA